MTLKTLTLSILAVVLLSACGQAGTAKSSSQQNSCDTADCSNGSNSGGSQEFEVKAQKTPGIISQRQLLPNFQNCLGMPDSAVSAATKAALAESISSLSQDGLVQDLNAPLMMSIAKITSELCQDLITNVEINSTTRKFFMGFSLSSNAATNNAQIFDMNQTLSALSKACWGRDITANEKALITSKITAGAKDKPTAIFVCTAVLSSAQAVQF